MTSPKRLFELACELRYAAVGRTVAASDLLEVVSILEGLALAQHIEQSWKPESIEAQPEKQL